MMNMDMDTPFEDVLESLLDESANLHDNTLFRLSNLGPGEVRKLQKCWADIPLERRRSLVSQMNSITKDDLLLAFEPIARFGLDDSDPQVRRSCVDILWQDESRGLEDRFIQMMESDEDYEVRASAAGSLGHFVWLGEIEDIPQAELQTITDSLIAVAKGSDHPLVRRRALEALGFSMRPEVPNLIEDAYGAEDEDWVVSALIAMGRSVDKRWSNDVIEMLDHENPDIRVEAARSAGELELREAGPALYELLYDDDDSARAAAIWSLSQIGGDQVAEVLSDLLDESEDDEEEAELIEAAMDNLAFTQDILAFSMFDFDPQEPEELQEVNNGSAAAESDPDQP